MDLRDLNLKSAARKLRVLVPPLWPVQVRSRPLAEVYGDCELVPEGKKGPFFKIRVCSNLDRETQVLILLHEWAHCLSWCSDSHRFRAHGPEWGIAVSRIWQAMIED